MALSSVAASNAVKRIRSVRASAPTRSCSQNFVASAKRVGLFGIRDDSNSSFMSGASLAPSAIRGAFSSPSSNTFCEHGVDIEAVMSDFGDIRQPDTHALVDEYIHNIMIKHKFLPIVMGGDHSVSFPVVKAVTRYLGQPVTIVHFDAHPDVYPDFEGNPHSHASPFARILETNNMCKKLVAIGIRCLNPVQREQYAKYKVSALEAKDFPAHGRDCAAFLQPLIAPTDLVYISFDMDVIEPGLAPGVSHREGGGLTVRQVVDAIHAVPGKVIGADLVELNPKQDVSGVTAVVAAKVMKELVSKMVRSNPYGS
jgi:arginase